MTSSRMRSLSKMLYSICGKRRIELTVLKTGRELSVRRKADKFEIRDGEILYRKKDGGVVGKCFICGIMHVRVVCTGMITCNSTLIILDGFILFLGEIRH